MHDRLIVMGDFIGISLKVKHENFDHISISRSCRQVNRLGSHVGVTVLGHGSLRDIVVGELVSHDVKD